MNVKLIFADRIDSWDTRADGSATTSHASLSVRGGSLELWSELKFDTSYDPSGETNSDVRESRTESGYPEEILHIDARRPPRDLQGWLAAAHDECGLLRLDVDGETIYQYEEPIEETDEREQIPVWSRSGRGSAAFGDAGTIVL